MRPIKFKGKHKATGEWVYGDLEHLPNDNVHIFGNHASQPVIPESVGQFTGLLDSGGKEIYEGDVVKISTSLEHAAKETQDNMAEAIGIKPPKWTYGGDETARVSFFDGAFHFIFLESFMPYGIGRQEPMLRYLFRERHPDEPHNYRIEMEVIGNIHEQSKSQNNEEKENNMFYEKSPSKS